MADEPIWPGGGSGGGGAAASTEGAGPPSTIPDGSFYVQTTSGVVTALWMGVSGVATKIADLTGTPANGSVNDAQVATAAGIQGSKLALTTPAAGDNSTAPATTAFVLANGSASFQAKSDVAWASSTNLAATMASGVLTANSNGVLSVDGAAPVVNDRVLLVGQTVAYWNGVFTVTNVGSVSTPWTMTRSADMTNASQVYGALVTVDGGASLAGSTWAVISKPPITMGSTAINWAQLSISSQALVAPLAPKASPALTGNPTAPTQTAGDNSTKLATTAFVAGATVDPPSLWIPASGYHETHRDRRFVVVTVSVGSGTLRLSSLPDRLVAGRSYSSISFFSAALAASSPTHQWFCVVRASDNTVLAVTADDTTTAWAANATKTLAFSSAYVPIANETVYLGYMVTAGTPPSLIGSASDSTFNSYAPAIGAASGSSLTTPPTVGSTIATPAGYYQYPYAVIS